MGWWPFSSSTSSQTVPGKEASKEPVVTRSESAQATPNTSTIENIGPPTATSDSVSLEKRNPYRNLESHKESSVLLGWQSYQETLKPMIWPHGISEWPAFGLSALFVASSALPSSLAPGLPPRLVRLVFGGAFATSGVAIQSGDEWNGASIATWWSASHVLVSSIFRTYRREIAKQAGKPLPFRSSPFAWVLTSATIATGAAYGVTL